MAVKDNQGMTKYFEKVVNFLVKSFPNIGPTWKTGKSTTGDSEEDNKPDDSEMEEGLVDISGMDLNKFTPYSK